MKGAGCVTAPAQQPFFCQFIRDAYSSIRGTRIPQRLGCSTQMQFIARRICGGLLNPADAQRVSHLRNKLLANKGKMKVDEQKLKEVLAEVVKRSGFPFQAKIQRIIEDTQDWQVHCSECPWCYKDREEFIDIIACKNNIYLTIECKRSGALKEARNSHCLQWPECAPKRSFVFLCRDTAAESSGETNSTLVTYCREEEYDDEPDSVYGANIKEMQFDPKSYESSICIPVDVDNPKEILERELSNLVRGCHEYASSMYSFMYSFSEGCIYKFLPVFVTTSPLYVLRFDAEKVSVEDGQYDFEADKLQQVPWMRFRKSLMADGSTISDERTVFIVEGKHFKEFLEQFKTI